MKHLFVVGILLISCGFISAIEWPKIDIGQILNPSILGKESIRAPAVPGKIQIQTITYNSVSRSIDLKEVFEKVLI